MAPTTSIRKFAVALLSGAALSAGLVACGSGSTTADSSDVPPFTVPTSTAVPASNPSSTTQTNTTGTTSTTSSTSSSGSPSASSGSSASASATPSAPATSTPSAPATG